MILETKKLNNFIAPDKLKNYTIEKSIHLLEEKISTYRLTTEKIKIEQNNIIINTSGSLSNLISFLEKIKLHFIIYSFKIFTKENKSFLTCTIKGTYLFNNNLINKEFEPIKETKTTITPTQPILIDAIIGNEVFIDEIWYKVGQIYTNHEIITINKNQITLKNLTTKKIIKVTLDDESL